MNIVYCLAIIVAALIVGWKLSSANAILWRLGAQSDRDVAVNDEADMGEQR